MRVRLRIRLVNYDSTSFIAVFYDTRIYDHLEANIGRHFNSRCPILPVNEVQFALAFV